jgi:hypothetical protein
VDDDGLPHLRNALRQGPALRVAQVAPPPPRLVEGPPAQAAPPAARRLTFWQVALRAVPIVIAIASTSGLAYFLLSDRSQPFAQLQQQSQEQAAEEEQSGEAAPEQRAQTEQQRQTQQQQVAPMQRPSMPSDEKLIMLINSALIALNQANATGNYTVLRDMAAPGFQQANSPERLAKVFSNLRSRNLDLTPILLFQPKLSQRPMINDRGMLRITGFFPTSPERVNFDLMFQPVQGKWRLYGIAANTQAVQPAQAAPAQHNTPAKAPAPAAAPAKPTAAEAVKPAAPAKKPAAKPVAAETEETAPRDVRDRIDNPPAPPPAEKPKDKRNIWNPFGR